MAELCKSGSWLLETLLSHRSQEQVGVGGLGGAGFVLLLSGTDEGHFGGIDNCQTRKRILPLLLFLR